MRFDLLEPSRSVEAFFWRFSLKGLSLVSSGETVTCLAGTTVGMGTGTDRWGGAATARGSRVNSFAKSRVSILLGVTDRRIPLTINRFGIMSVIIFGGWARVNSWIIPRVNAFPNAISGVPMSVLPTASVFEQLSFRELWARLHLMRNMATVPTVAMEVRVNKLYRDDLTRGQLGSEGKS
ncbi:hypothetical protein F2Q69_00013592 [Brassica cretica]|uniref:Uncharacterized protein n=1 Tax=Brassica cretica TaxID=69181 RepID=A0A8S9R118_BRACR|nr:hypothetical protein F2Q69_00013592 [Brassica cretica]